MQVLILCGGKGTRAYPYTEYISKPMMPICGQPILSHLIKIYAAQGHREFILSLGYKKEVIIDYFDGRFSDLKIEFVDTGEESDTGQRIEKCKHLLDETFFVTYADGLGNVNLSRLLAFHKDHGAEATLTSVRLPSQYGTIDICDESMVKNFKEKPIIDDYWINAGFFVFNKSVFKYWTGTNLEKHVLPRLSELKKLYAYKHIGFWKSMDTFKDLEELESVICADKEIFKVKREKPSYSLSTPISRGAL